MKSLEPQPVGRINQPQTRHGKGFSVVYLSSGAPWGITRSRVYVKTQMHYNCRPCWRAWRLTPTTFCEFRALRACTQLGLSVPKVLSYRIEEGVAELVLQEIEHSMPLDDFMAQSGSTERMQVVTALAKVLAKLHRAGWSHGSLGNPHILVQPTNGNHIWLIDFEKARWRVGSGQADLDRLWRRTHSFTEHDKAIFYQTYSSF